MPEPQDFERAWLNKLSNSLEQTAGEEVRDQVLAGSEGQSSASSRQEVIEWTQGAILRLESLVEEDQWEAVLTSCACQYPKSDLQDVKESYQATGDIDLAHSMLQAKFESFLRDTLQLDEAMFQEIVGRGWGVAGVKQGNTIIAIKIPKSGYLVEYMNESDPERRQQLYCHCPRVRDAAKLSESISPTYCYCGAGFYKGIWEHILDEPVEVEVLETVLSGGEVCKIAIHLPEKD